MAARLPVVLKANAVLDLVSGLLLLMGTWDGLWDALDLPQARPALFVQIGGATLLGLAYAMWRAADADAALRAPVAMGAALADGLGAVLIVAWLLSGNLEGVGALGTTLLILVALILAAFTVLKAGGARDLAR